MSERSLGILRIVGYDGLTVTVEQEKEQTVPSGKRLLVPHSVLKWEQIPDGSTPHVAEVDWGFLLDEGTEYSGWPKWSLDKDYSVDGGLVANIYMEDEIAWVVGPHGTRPTLGSELACAYDIYAAEDVAIVHGERRTVPTQLSIDWKGKASYWASLRTRSGMAAAGWDVAGGVIDPDYAGEIGVILVNSTGSTLQVRRGDRIAQLVFHPVAWPVRARNRGSVRGNSGFGSTGS